MYYAYVCWIHVKVMRKTIFKSTLRTVDAVESVSYCVFNDRRSSRIVLHTYLGIRSSALNLKGTSSSSLLLDSEARTCTTRISLARRACVNAVCNYCKYQARIKTQINPTCMLCTTNQAAERGVSQPVRASKRARGRSERRGGRHVRPSRSCSPREPMLWRWRCWRPGH